MATYYKPQSGSSIVNGASYLKKKSSSDTSTIEHRGVGTVLYDNLDSLRLETTPNGRFLNGDWATVPLLISGTTVIAVHTDANLYLPAEGAGRAHILRDAVMWSYDDAFSGSGSIEVQSPSGVSLWGPHQITQSGPNELSMGDGLKCPDNTDMFIVLAGFTGVTSTFTVRNEVR